MGAEKWLDIEVWDSTLECFNVLKSRGYRIATAHLSVDSVLITSSLVCIVVSMISFVVIFRP